MTDNGDHEQQDTRNTPSVLHNGIRILHAFSVDEPALGVTEIARRINLHKSTASRILGQLEQMDLVVRDSESGRFRLGLGLIGLAGPLLANLDVRRIAYPALEQLTERTGETSALVVWSGHESVSVEQVASPKQVKHTTPIGTRYSTSASASVQVFLTDMPEDQVRALLEGHLMRGGHSDEYTVRRYLNRLSEVRSTGVAVNAGETNVEEVGISAPVRDHRGHVSAALLLSAPSFRISSELRAQLAEIVRDTAAQISERLGAGRREAEG
ncbi:IclR family transcriptional regulator [Halopolyspora algeriensis]|uniref:IclR family transcriptional regulator n=1 Tax=Halopolyspora algeriensis TaxID=1500506 RepID=A0A368VRS4_9ACTN|nr:IclR family transcriptional regulator [Halopolyspora algeriensis]RCW44441.1 IclR family transcriptional regulator [Halopolyspora algeriensis]TQM55802.1 IclR family transcriptional regulator [Halopolyspora algeriensis]